jgi:hypothetical protein
MKVILDIMDSKALFFMQLLSNFSFVKARPITHETALLFQEMNEAVNAVNLIKQGKLQARPAKALLNEI